MPDGINAAIWPALDYSRVPYRLYHDRDVYECEQERIFRGPVWNYLALEAEIPNPGDFRATYVGDTPVIVNRDRSGAITAFVNRCAHRGAIVRRELSGNASEHTCIYHQWCYDLGGNLTGIPFRRGIRGKGGMDPSFDMGAHALQPLRVETLHGAIFGTLANAVEPLETYLGPAILTEIHRLLHRPVKVLGYTRQRIKANWKLYAENTRDNYHASLLHDFLRTFGMDRSTQVGGVRMDARHRHNITWAEADSDTEDTARDAYSTANIRNDRLALREPGLVRYRQERPGDRLNLIATSVFPAAVFMVLSNSLAIRQVRPRGLDEVEVHQTMLGYEDDTPEMTEHRLNQANLVGPAGLVSMEDGEALEIVHRSSRPDSDRHTVIELGGGGVISDRDYRVSDVPLRGFWSYYAELLGIELNRRGAVSDLAAVIGLLAEYGGLLDQGRHDDWLGLFAAECRYSVMPRENYERQLPVALIACTTRASLEDRIEALREANKYNIHSDRHIIGLPRLLTADGLAIEAPFAVYQSDQEGETRLFATGLYHLRLTREGAALKIADNLVLLDTFAVPSLLATPL